eukprot:gene55255-47843_t
MLAMNCSDEPYGFATHPSDDCGECRCCGDAARRDAAARAAAAAAGWAAERNESPYGGAAPRRRSSSLAERVAADALRGPLARPAASV